MLTIGIVDANSLSNQERTGLADPDIPGKSQGYEAPGAVVSGWLAWEAGKAGIELKVTEPATWDLVLLVFAGAKDYPLVCKRELRKRRIDPDPRTRERPYVITGGAVDATPLTALDVADAVALGEGFQFARALFNQVAGGATVQDIRTWIAAYPHAIERSQLKGIERDPARPWMLSKVHEPLGSVDPVVDYDIPPIYSDKVIRVIGSKGCHKKCAFCATTFRQAYTQNPDGPRVLREITAIRAKGRRAQLLSNDPADLPYFRELKGRMDSESFTISELADDANRAAIIRNGIGIARFGVEGLSERIRAAFGKAVTNERILDVITDFASHHIGTHLFLIPGAPFEAQQDWDEFRDFFEQLTRRLARLTSFDEDEATGKVTRGTLAITRIKMTKFEPSPPAPLARFVPDTSYWARIEGFTEWLHGNATNRYVVPIWPRQPKQHVKDVADALNVPLPVAAQLTAGPGTFDLAPTLDEARRMPWELVAWPLSVEIRFKQAEVFKRRMTEVSDQPRRRVGAFDRPRNTAVAKPVPVGAAP